MAEETNNPVLIACAGALSRRAKLRTQIEETITRLYRLQASQRAHYFMMCRQVAQEIFASVDLDSRERKFLTVKVTSSKKKSRKDPPERISLLEELVRIHYEDPTSPYNRSRKVSGGVFRKHFGKKMPSVETIFKNLNKKLANILVFECYLIEHETPTMTKKERKDLADGKKVYKIEISMIT